MRTLALLILCAMARCYKIQNDTMTKYTYIHTRGGEMQIANIPVLL